MINKPFVSHLVELIIHCWVVFVGIKQIFSFQTTELIRILHQEMFTIFNLYESVLLMFHIARLNILKIVGISSKKVGKIKFLDLDNTL